VNTLNLNARKVSDYRWNLPAKNTVNLQTVLGDFNRDGKTDFALSMMDIDGKTNDIFLFIASQDRFIDGTALIKNPEATYQTSNILSADLNKDGYTDLIVARSGGDPDTLPNNGIEGDSQLIYLSNSKGEYSAIKSTEKPYIHNVMIEDFDGDGDIDAFFLATSVGPSLIAKNELDSNQTIVFGSDGLPKKTVEVKTYENWDVLERYPNGSLKKMQGWHNHNTAFNDIDRDGDFDMVLFFAGSSEGKIYLNDSSGNFNSKPALTYDARIPEIPSSGYFLYGLLNDDGSWKGLRVTKQGANYYETIQFDINSDGWKDIVAVATLENQDFVNIGGKISDQNGTDRFNHGTFYSVLINSGTGLVNDTQARVTQPNITTKEKYHYGHFTMLSSVDLNGDGHLDFTSNQGSGVISGNPNWAGESDTVFMLNDGKGKFSQIEIAGMRYGRFDPIPIEGKLGFVTVTMPTAQDWRLPGFPPRPWAQLEFYQTDVPWTIGNHQNNFLYGTVADDLIDGLDGVDTVYVNGRRSEFELAFNQDLTLTDKTGLFGRDTLKQVERIRFDDSKLAFDLSGNAGKVVKLLGATFGKSALTNKEYVGAGLSLLDQGMSYQDLAALALSVTKKSSATDICNLLWTNIFGKAPTAADIAPYKAMLDSGQMSIGALATLAADTTFNTTNIGLVGLSQTGIEYV
jgi:FG-GAP-like repeat